MKREYLEAMTVAEIESYASMLGIDMAGTSTKAQKVARVEERRGRCAEVSVLGLTVTVPLKRLHDKRVSDLAERDRLTNEDAWSILELVLGGEQFEALVERCTDEDGTQDLEALTFAMRSILSDEGLKNF